MKKSKSSTMAAMKKGSSAKGKSSKSMPKAKAPKGRNIEQEFKDVMKTTK